MVSPQDFFGALPQAALARGRADRPSLEHRPQLRLAPRRRAGEGGPDGGGERRDARRLQPVSRHDLQFALWLALRVVGARRVARGGAWRDRRASRSPLGSAASSSGPSCTCRAISTRSTSTTSPCLVARGSTSCSRRPCANGSAGIDPYAAHHAALGRTNARSLLNRLLYADSKTYLHELLMKQDQMSMAASIESRVPFLDHPLTEFAAALAALDEAARRDDEVHSPAGDAVVAPAGDPQPQEDGISRSRSAPGSPAHSATWSTSSSSRRGLPRVGCST